MINGLYLMMNDSKKILTSISEKSIIQNLGKYNINMFQCLLVHFIFYNFVSGNIFAKMYATFINISQQTKL